MRSCLIVGCGNIGNQLYNEYERLKPDRYDPFKGIREKKSGQYDLAFICVDTPMLQNGSCDLSQVLSAITETDAKIIVLRSTVPPGTTQKLVLRTGKKIVFSPEFYGVTQHSDRSKFSFDFTILGGEPSWCGEVVQALQEVYDARHEFCITDSKSAELAKYMENTMLATRVSMCVKFWEICQELGASYPKVRELLLKDGRFNRAHTFVYDDHPFWESHCFDKDLPALATICDAPLIQSVIDYNETCKKRYGKSVIHDC